MKPIIAAAALALLTVNPAFAEDAYNCDPNIDMVETLSQEEHPVLYIPDDWIGRTMIRIEAVTGHPYGKVEAVTVVELPEHDVALVHDIGGCTTIVELDTLFF